MVQHLRFNVTLQEPIVLLPHMVSGVLFVVHHSMWHAAVLSVGKGVLLIL